MAEYFPVAGCRTYRVRLNWPQLEMTTRLSLEPSARCCQIKDAVARPRGGISLSEVCTAVTSADTLNGLNLKNFRNKLSAVTSVC